MASADRGAETTVDERDRRAAEEYLVTVEVAPGLVEVYAHDGTPYLVDVRGGACQCPDFRYREPDDGCKHLRRVQMERGERPIPDGVEPELNLRRCLEDLDR